MNVTGPDFLCVGMQKAGTGWLYDQLQFHPDFWMPPAKELHYFDRTFPSGKFGEMIRDDERSPGRFIRKREKNDWRPLDDRDTAFFADAKACAGAGIDLAVYAALFRHKGSLLSGDITPAYSTLKDEIVRALADYFPETKVILLLRDPVLRAWSQVCMTWRRKGHPAETLQDPAKFREYLHSESVRKRSFATETFKRWSSHVGSGRIRHFFLDDIASNPETTRAQILSFVGADPAKPSGTLEASFNRKSDQQKIEMTELNRSILIEHFSGEVQDCAKLFGGPALNWKARYGL